MARARTTKRRMLHSAGFALFGETLLVGIVVAVCVLPAVTALAGLAAGARHLKRHVAGEGDGIRSLLEDLGTALRTLLVPGIALVAALLAVAFDLWLLTFVDVPGKGAVTIVLLGAAGLAVLIAVRFAAGWVPGTPWRRQVREALRLTWTDVAGSALLAAAIGGVAVFAWMYPPLVLIAGGLLALAGVGVEMRRLRRAELGSGG